METVVLTQNNTIPNTLEGNTKPTTQLPRFTCVTANTEQSISRPISATTGESMQGNNMSTTNPMTIIRPTSKFTPPHLSSLTSPTASSNPNNFGSRPWQPPVVKSIMSNSTAPSRGTSRINNRNAATTPHSSTAMGYPQGDTDAYPLYPQQQQQQQQPKQQMAPPPFLNSNNILSKRVVEHDVRVPKRVTREDLVEKVILVPEKVEEIVEDVARVREKIIEVAKPVYQERIVEIPEIEYIEKIIEVPEIIYQEKIREVPRIEIQERIIEVPKIITQERIVEIPEIEYQEVIYEKIVEVPEIVEQVVIKEIPVPQYVERSFPAYVTTEIEHHITRNIPLPVEQITTVNLKIPQIRPRYTKVDVPLYVPRFIEIPLPAELMDPVSISQAENYAQQIALIGAQTAASLCEVERLGGNLKKVDDFYAKIFAVPSEELNTSLARSWNTGRLPVSKDIKPRVSSKDLNETYDRDSQQEYEIDNQSISLNANEGEKNFQEEEEEHEPSLLQQQQEEEEEEAINDNTEEHQRLQYHDEIQNTTNNYETELILMLNDDITDVAVVVEERNNTLNEFSEMENENDIDRVSINDCNNNDKIKNEFFMPHQIEDKDKINLETSGILMPNYAAIDGIIHDDDVNDEGFAEML